MAVAMQADVCPAGVAVSDGISNKEEELCSAETKHLPLGAD